MSYRLFNIHQPLPLSAITVFLTVIACVLILAKGLTMSDGYLTQDSAGYLELAENILAGNGFTVSNSGSPKAESVSYATWPVGYPLLIALTSKIANVSTFTASKMLNIGALLIAMFAVTRAFGRDGPILALVFLFAGTIETFAFTWSEGVFIMLLVLICILLAQIAGAEAPPGPKSVVLLIILAICLFLVRYIGLFILAPISLVALMKAVQHDLRTMALLLVAMILTGLAAGTYLYVNQVTTGFATGIPRPPSTETHMELLAALGMALLRELVLPIPYWIATDFKHNLLFLCVVLGVMWLILLARRSKPATANITAYTLPLSFLIVGGLYLAAIIVTRWSSHLDPFGFRLLAPGTTLIFIGIFSAALIRYKSLKQAIHVFLVAMASMSLAVHAVMARSNITSESYFEATVSRAEAYAVLPEGAIVLSGRRHLRYMRPDVHVLRLPSGVEPGTQDLFSMTMQSLDPTRPVYLELGWRARNFDRHPISVRTFIETCDQSFYLHAIGTRDGVWSCRPLVRKP